MKAKKTVKKATSSRYANKPTKKSARKPRKIRNVFVYTEPVAEKQCDTCSPEDTSSVSGWGAVSSTDTALAQASREADTMRSAYDRAATSGKQLQQKLAHIDAQISSLHEHRMQVIVEVEIQQSDQRTVELMLDKKLNDVRRELNKIQPYSLPSANSAAGFGYGIAGSSKY